MNNIQLTVFDIFSYILPGLCYIILIWTALHEVDLSTFIGAISKLSFYSFLAYSFISYLLGFTADVVASAVIVGITDKIRGDFRSRVITDFLDKNPGISIPDYHFGVIYSFADVKAPNARQKADQYSAMSGLARNLSLFLLVFALTTVVSAALEIQTVPLFFLLLKVASSLILSVILMFRADTFRFWSHSHLLHVYFLLNSEEHHGNEQQNG